MRGLGVALRDMLPFVAEPYCRANQHCAIVEAEFVLCGDSSKRIARGWI